ncbi:hypothetical protein LPA44_13015 [Halobacterium sp. KA-4]|uniref:hypothetical protein n=1 Tax=Halobacterium sp. KA-4 TaxID=2896367 RepID=UPI001E336A88|nr:hypothetical protein [Halobacterium sp. KA-4]MCD2200810.1 hypothetical protein [Halobacterium sp. KA-4]
MLGSGSIFTIAGCLHTDSLPTISISNQTSDRIDIKLVVRDVEEEDPVIDETFSLDADGDKSYSKPFETSGEKELKITVNVNRSERHTWNDSPSSSGSVLTVSILEEEINIEEAVS